MGSNKKRKLTWNYHTLPATSRYVLVAYRQQHVRGIRYTVSRIVFNDDGTRQWVFPHSDVIAWCDIDDPIIDGEPIGNNDYQCEICDCDYPLDKCRYQWVLSDTDGYQTD